MNMFIVFSLYTPISFSFFFFKKFIIEVQLIYNVMVYNMLT